MRNPSTINHQPSSANLKLTSERRAFLDISFSWIFAIIIGGFILFGAIYGVTKFINIEESKTSGESALEFGTLLNPLELGIESEKSAYISMPLNSRINNKCSVSGTFGSQAISVDEYIRNQWTNSEIDSYFKNKYIFSMPIEEGKGFYVFSKEFDYPFEISSLIYLTSENDIYCFADPPASIKKDLENIDQKNIKIGSSCLKNGSISVCFGRKNCDIIVDYQGKTVEKDDDVVYFDSDSLMYAAIFSDKRNYECQLSRLMKRTNELIKIYETKALDISSRGCISDTLTILNQLESYLDSYSSSEDLSQYSQLIKNLEVKNNAQCKLW